MSISTGASGAIFQDRFTLDCNVVETRQYPYRNSDCWGVAQKAISNGIYLIFTICVEPGYNPTDWEWKHRVEMVAQKLISYGANRNNCLPNFLNEPMQYVTKERYVHLINLGTDQISDRFDTGAGNEEFGLAADKGDMYPYILINARFKRLLIHIQTSCLTEATCNHWCAVARNWAIKYHKVLDCSEANYSDVATDKGYKTLLMQLSYAEQIGCKHFPVVFIGLSNESKYERLSFIYNGHVRSPYWEDFKKLMKAKAPIPKPIIISEDDMKLEKFYYKNKVTYNRDTKKAGVKFIQTVVIVDPDGKWGTITDTAVKDYQEDFDLDIDGIVGPLTFREMMKTDPEAYIDLQYFVATGEW